MKSKEKILAIVLFTITFFLTRLPRLNNDEINPDAVNWHYRSQQFIVGLKTLQFEKTYQHYHPGVTLMWIMGVPVELTKQITGINVIDRNNFEMFHFISKSALVFAQYILTIILILALGRILDFKSSLIITALFTFEPFFVGSSRLLHMDILLTILVILTLCFSYLSLTNENKYFTLLGGIFAGLGFLTKSIGITLPLYIICLYIYKKASVKKIGVFIATFILTTVAFFPALWVKPFYYISEIFSEAERIGIRKGHDQIVMGDFTNEAGPEFYPLVILIKFSPLILAGTLMYFVFGRKGEKYSERTNYKKSFVLYIFVYYFGYLLAMTFPTKKIDRYILVMFPLFAVFAYYGYLKLVNLINKKTLNIFLISFMVMIFWIYPLIKMFPYYFVYSSPLFISPETANKVIGQKSFGVGIFDLKNHILKKYGDYPNLGFLDTKPMKSIYPNSKVFDIRISGKNDYDLLILAINEELPENLVDEAGEFKKDSVLYINDLPYWTIYVR